MKKKVFDRLVEKELKIFKNYVLDDDEFMIEFLSNMSIDFDNYITHDTVFRDYFGMHFYPFWHNPNQEDFTVLSIPIYWNIWFAQCTPMTQKRSFAICWLAHLLSF